MINNITIGIGFFALGVILRLSAYSLAWPTNFRYSGPRENTKWAVREAAYIDISMYLVLLGGLLIVFALAVAQFKKLDEHTKK